MKKRSRKSLCSKKQVRAVNKTVRYVWYSFFFSL